MTEYTSFMKDTIYEFIKYRKASQCWNDNYEIYLKRFEKYCLNNYDNSNKLTQEMIDSWCTKRNTELNKSCNSRIAVVIAFLKYTNSRNITNLNIPSMLKPEKCTYIPHAFTEQELNNFFYACDNLEIQNNTEIKKNEKLTIPIFFRLLYSTGIRTTEARLLKVEDIDLNNGIINVKKSKGYNQHYIVLNDLMKTYLVEYNKEINKLYPNRTYFFPDKNDGFHDNRWVCIKFKKYWQMYNNSYAIPYDLRHNYAITNINNWTNKGVEFNDKLYYLSKSMGHSNIESTKYYYSLIPRMSDIFKTQVNATFNLLVPEVNDYE